MCLNLAQTSIRADSPSGKTPQATHNPCPSAYLAVETSEDVVRPDIAPVLAGELEVRQRFANSLHVHVRGRVQLHLAQFAFNVLDLG